jgi:ligand-binding sensor domain-containing protein/signal transduction histidine kinase
MVRRWACAPSSGGCTIKGVRSKARHRRGCLVWLIPALGVWTACALSAAPPPAKPAPNAQNYTTRVWQTQDGLPQQTVQAVAQTQDGFVWIGTTGGLLRFDGTHFFAFDRENTPAFREDSIFSLTCGRDGTLWIGTEGGGLLRMKDGEFRHFGVADGLLDGFVRKVLEDESGKIWIGTDNGLFQLANSHAERATRVDGTAELPAMAVHALAQTTDGDIWVGGSRLVALRGQVATEYPLVGKLGETRVKSILQTRDGTVWVGTVSGLQRLVRRDQAFERFAGVQGTVRTLDETVDGALWMGTIGQGAYVLRDGKLTEIETGRSDGLALPSKTVLSLFEDAERNVWMGTQAGLLRFSRSPVELVPLPGASDSDFETISRDTDGTLWVAGTRLSHLVHGVAIPTNFAPLHGARVRNVFRAQDGTLWVGTDGSGLFHLTDVGAKRATQYTTADGLVNNFIRGIVESKGGDLWVATDEGVSRLSRGAFRNFTVRDGLAYFSVRSLLEDHSGGLWIGTDRGLSHLVGESFVRDAATKALGSEKVWALEQSTSGALWFGTRDNGLYRYVSGEAETRHYTSEQGLASNSVYSIMEDPRGKFWIGGVNGVEVVSVHALETAAKTAHAYLTQRFFKVSAGGELSPLYGGTQPSGAMTADGEAWFPTSKGPVRFLSGDATSSTFPRVFLDRVVADGRALSQDKPIHLSADNRNLEITYGAILLGPQDSVQFQYKMENFDRDWRYSSTSRVADYTNLPAGHYVFRVRAFEDAAGLTMAPQTERRLEIDKSQYFFLTWWFLSCCASLLALGVWLVHRQRVRRVEMAFQAVLEERARLAREMHDTLIQGCAGVSLLLEACSAETTGAVAQLELLDYARTQLAVSIDEARQAVWNLRGQTSVDLVEALQRLTERLDRGSNIEVECTIEGEAYAFHAAAMHEISMASREAIYNALLHAEPTRIEVRASFDQEMFSLTVTDNGSGFESTGQAPEGHYGLVGIQERIRRLGGSVDVRSTVKRGTRVYIQVPRSSVSFDSQSPVQTQQEQEWEKMS